MRADHLLYLLLGLATLVALIAISLRRSGHLSAGAGKLGVLVAVLLILAALLLPLTGLYE